MNFAWSYSRLRNFETCPKRHYHYDIAKDVKEPESPQMQEGHTTHKAFELRISENKPLPMPLVYHEKIMSQLANLPGETYAEQRLGLTKDFQPVAFFGQGVWFRTVLDLVNVSPDRTTAAVIDYKTGKPSADNTQLELMSATVMHYDQQIERVRARLLFVNHNKAERAEYVRSDLPRIWGNILPRVRDLERAQIEQEYPPKPNGLCIRYCAVVSCPFHGRGSGDPRRN